MNTSTPSNPSSNPTIAQPKQPANEPKVDPTAPIKTTEKVANSSNPSSPPKDGTKQADTSNAGKKH